MREGFNATDSTLLVRIIFGTCSMLFYYVVSLKSTVQDVTKNDDRLRSICRVNCSEKDAV